MEYLKELSYAVIQLSSLQLPELSAFLDYNKRDTKKKQHLITRHDDYTQHSLQSISYLRNCSRVGLHHKHKNAKKTLVASTCTRHRRRDDLSKS